MARHRRRKCRHCKDLFIPDPRNRKRQKYCSKPDCRYASKVAAQRKWRSGKGADYFRGLANIVRVQQWRRKNPDYSQRKRDKPKKALRGSLTAQPYEKKRVKPELTKTALQDCLNTQSLVLTGLVAELAGDADIALQGNMDSALRSLLNKGQRLREQGFHFEPLLEGVAHEY